MLRRRLNPEFIRRLAQSMSQRRFITGFTRRLA